VLPYPGSTFDFISSILIFSGDDKMKVDLELRFFSNCFVPHSAIANSLMPLFSLTAGFCHREERGIRLDDSLIKSQVACYASGCSKHGK